jgi:predicted CXXCH cytochrome family protein
MIAGLWFVALAVPALFLLFQLFVALGRKRGFLAGLCFLPVLIVGWLLLGWHSELDPAVGQEGFRQVSVASDACFMCHPTSYTSWHRTYHRTMTREATREYVKGDFNNASYKHQGITSRLTREGGTFFMETADPVWTAQVSKAGRRPEDVQPPRLRKYKIDRLVGSHWSQEYLSLDEEGRYWRLPLAYHLVEGRWIHIDGAFLAPEGRDFWSKGTVWNDSCIFCHDTKPSERPDPAWRRAIRGAPGFDTQVAELGVACEACHGPGGEHVQANHNPARRFALEQADVGDPTIVNPRRLSIERADAICAHCHGALVPKREAWDALTVTDPYNAGEDLTRSFAFFWSEVERDLIQAGRRPDPKKPPLPGPLDGRFWGDGTPLTTAVEYQGMALSACYQNGRGRLSCLSCHSMHYSDPNFQLAAGMGTNEACYQCHADYRDRLVEHTHHPPGSPASLCYNCHMPHQVYSLMNTHRSHRIERLEIKDSLGTGKPHACNLCHLDKSLGWTQDWLVKWYQRTPLPLPTEEKNVASSLLHLCRSDARSRAVFAGAFSWPPAQAASGTDWPGLFLVHILEQERYPAVRYLVYRGLLALQGRAASGFDYLANATQRKAQLRPLRARLERRRGPTGSRYPYLPLAADGKPADAVLDRLLDKRNDPDVVINE